MHKIPQVLVLIVYPISLSLGHQAFAADDVIRRLNSWTQQRDGWQEYRDQAQKQLNFDRKAIERVREMADIGAREREGYSAAKDVLKGSPGALKDSFMRTAAGELPSVKEIKDDFKRVDSLGKEIKAFDEAKEADINKERLEARANSLQKESAQLEKSIAIADRVIDYSAKQAANLAASSEVWFQRLPEWAQAGLNKVAAAQQRQERQRAEQAQRDKEKRDAETVPAGWQACTCPAQHTAYGRVIKGVRYHPPGPVCPQ